MTVFRSIIFLFSAQVSLVSFGQSVSSVYSNNGVGLINYQGLPHNTGMGEVGIGVPSIWNMNYLNPAFLPLNGSTIFQVGVEMDRRQIASETIEAKKISGGLRYLNLAFPVINGTWTSAIGISPYSTVNTKTISYSTLDDNTATITANQGSGGLTAFQWSNGFRIKNSFYVGLRTSAMFGSIENSESTQINDGLGSYGVEFTDRTSYSGLKFDFALGYRKFIGEEKALNFGFLYELSKDLNGSHDLWKETSAIPKRLIVNNETTSFKLPSSYGIGFSYQVLNKLTLGTDVVLTNWASAGDDSQEYFNTYKLSFGGQLTPDYSSVSSYWKRATYRMGFSFNNLPYQAGGQTLKELGINFGGSFPIGYSNLDWALKYGKLGVIQNGLIRENYFKIVIGASMNDRWFIKRRYD